MYIEQHFYEGKNHTVKIEYRVYKNDFTYTVKTRSQLTKTEKSAPKKLVYHF